ncbi:CoA-transferase family III domain-containing protein [Aspergillus avenaceus]|uniref:CoA-transferase family III domain-containing protein n=1 Tax=Aspergillus avenaceus TaxID=36643 RepID=A0A5N6U1Q7_ASPAV|nr:CoA-transferase family III domain-containing protein [Aspergillus avenaceus]
MAHETNPGTDIYGPGTFIDKNVLPVPEDARRVFEFLAKKTPGFTQNTEAWNTVRFEGNPDPMIPGPIKAPVVAAALHGMCGVVANELLELRDGKPVSDSSVTINTDQSAIWLGSALTAQVNGSEVASIARSGKLSTLFDRDFEQGFGKGFASRATAIYQTKDPNVWYQLHGSLHANKALDSMGIDTSVTFDSPSGYYDYIQEHVRQWSADELEMHNVRHGLCGSICYTPESWRKTEMGKQLAKHPYVNYTQETYAAPTPKQSLPKVSGDQRPLAGVKVLEMVRIIAGPTIGVTLAAFGADVIRVNCSKLPDLNVLQLVLNAGKRTVDLDITKPDDMTRLRELVADVDVFVQGFRYGSLERKGLGLCSMLELAAKRNKGIIFVDENCYGPDGPFAERPGWQQIGDAASGSSYVMDMTTGLLGSLATLMALRDRAVKGGSYHVISSLVAADNIALDAEVGLYPPEVVQQTAEKFGFAPTTPDQFVTEILFQVVDGWKKGRPGCLDLDSPLMVTLDKGPWGELTVLKPVVRLGDDQTTPRWTSPPVPNCYHDRNVTWR